jgi:hypothetical protein
MHSDLKALLKIIIIPTIIWGILDYWHFLYLNGKTIGFWGYISPDIVAPFEVAHVFLIIGYILTMIFAYVFEKKKELEGYYGKLPKYYEKS